MLIFWRPILKKHPCVYTGEFGLVADIIFFYLCLHRWVWAGGLKELGLWRKRVLHCLIRSKTRTHILVGVTQEHNSGNDTQWCWDWGRGLSGIAGQAHSLSVQKCSDVCRFSLVTFHFKVHAPDVKIFSFITVVEGFSQKYEANVPHCWNEPHFPVETAITVLTQ